MRGVRSLLLAALPLLPAGLVAAAPATPEVWVVNRAARSIKVLDTTTNAVLATIPISDPDADHELDSPEGISFSTVPGASGLFAFVVQDQLVTVIDVKVRAVARVFDLEALLGFPDVALRSCSSAAPRSFLSGSGSVVRSYLHVVAQRPGNASWYVVLDQERLLPGSTLSPLVASGLLEAGTTAIGVTALETPHGSQHQRVRYALVETGTAGDEILAVLVAKGPALFSPWSVVETTRVHVPVGSLPPDAYAVASPSGGGELPVLPEMALGRLENLDTGGACEGAGGPASVSVTGPGADSYTVLSVDQQSGKLLVLDPTTCRADSVPTGGHPMHVTALGAIRWRTAYVVNRDSDSVTRVDRDGAVTQIPLGGTGPCALCPVAAGVPFQQSCAIETLAAAKVDEDGDLVKDDLELSWSSCGADSYELWCQCVDVALEECPCACDCENDPAPECECGGFTLAGLAASGPLADFVLQEPPWTPQKNPWKVLGITGGTSFVVEDVATFSGVAYSVVPVDPP